MSDQSRKLNYGETPWDKLPPEQLLREVQRMYAALVSAHSALLLLRGSQHDGFWSVPGDGQSRDDSGGTGGRALEKGRMVLDELHSRFDQENIYRAFFRYAVDLLFTPELGFQWTACDGCQELLGSYGNGESPAGKSCPTCARQGRHFIRRPLEWRDVQPETKETA